MKIPTIQGIIKRRVLVNYRVEPEVIQNILPNGFSPKLHKGKAIAGICLIKLGNIRPKLTPRFIGISSENAAHRIAVKWNKNGESGEGVYIPRRDTDSLLNHLAGGRLFSSEHYKAVFDISEDDNQIQYSMKSDDGEVSLHFSGRPAETFPKDSIFDSLETASDFFEKGSLGFSPNKRDKDLDGLNLEIESWKVTNFEIDAVRSSFYDNKTIFPTGSINFDHALLMRNIDHEWHTVGKLRIKN
jgi:uncharacterized protein YqjF (DUF2071 family)